MRALAKTERAVGLNLIEVPVPQPGPDDVLVRVVAASICGTDVHIYEWDAWSAGRIRPPLVLGHEFAGVVEAVGSGVTGIEIGAPVSAEGHVVPDAMARAMPGLEHLAPGVEVLGIDRAGAFAEFVVVPEQNIWRNPPDLAPEIASLQDPLGNAVHTVHAQPVAGRVVLITGAGLIGLMAVPVAKVAGAARIVVTDVNARRLEVARSLGADDVLDARSDVVGAIHAMTGGMGADVLLEMSGHPQAINQGLAALKPGGEAAILGLPPGNVELDWGNLIVLKGLTVRGIYGRRIWETWHTMRALLTTGAIDLAPLITHDFPLADFEAAFAVMRSGEGGKVILRPGTPE
jgi:threonine 3-dehydrogenase